ncbi:MAG: 50S ribosomal protein L25 [bacterium]|nr:50S ribosomal protein L25 [bacterium]
MELKIESRNQIGKTGVKQLRKIKKVPAVLYSKGKSSMYLQLDEKQTKSLHEGEHITLDCGEKYDALIKEIQIDPIAMRTIHIDFQELKAKEKIKVKIPVIIEGEELVIKHGWVMERGMDEVEIECLPKDIPDSFKIDAGKLKDGESLHVKDLQGLVGRFITKEDTLLVSVKIPKVIVEETPAATTEAGAEATTEAGTGAEKTSGDKSAEKTMDKSAAKPGDKAAEKPAAKKPKS